VRVRQANPSDALAIATVHVRSWKAAYPGLIPQRFLDSLTPQARLEMWNQTLGGPDGRDVTTLVLVSDAEAGRATPREAVGADAAAQAEPEQILGFTSFGSNSDGGPRSVGEVMTLYLDPTAWGRRLGELLLASAVEQLQRDGYRAATLWVLETNARARRFYERLGWAPDGAVKLHDWKAFVATDVRYRLGLVAGEETRD
jgi:ribosomal protein S18 acetylase RimI-like enzyme